MAPTLWCVSKRLRAGRKTSTVVLNQRAKRVLKEAGCAVGFGGCNMYLESQSLLAQESDIETIRHRSRLHINPIFVRIPLLRGHRWRATAQRELPFWAGHRVPAASREGSQTFTRSTRTTKRSIPFSCESPPARGPPPERTPHTSLWRAARALVSPQSKP